MPILLKSLLVLVALSSSLATAAPKKNRKPAATPSESQVLRKLFEIEEARDGKDKALLSALSHPSRRVVKTAAIAAGRIGATAAIEDLARLLNGKDAEMKATAAFALGLMGGELAHKLLTQQIEMIKDPTPVAAILVAIGRTGGESSVSLFHTYLKDGVDGEIQEAAAHGLGLLWSQESTTWQVPEGLLVRLAKMSQGEKASALTAAFALSRFKGDANLIPSIDLAEAVSKSLLVYARAFVIKALSRNKSLIAASSLSKELSGSTHLPIRTEAARGLANQEMSDSVAAALTKAMEDSNSGLAAVALQTVTHLGPEAVRLTDAVEKTLRTSASPWVRGEALKALSRLSPEKGRARVIEILATPASPLAGAAAHSLALLGTAPDLDRLSHLITGDNTKVAVESIEILQELPDETFTPGLKAALRQALEKGDVGLTSLVAQLTEKLKWKDMALPLSTAYPLFTSRDQVEAKVGILSALGSVGDYTHVPLLQGALSDADRVVVQAAVMALRSITGKDESARIPLASRPSALTPSAEAVQAAGKAKVVIKTNRGEIVLKMLSSSPANTSNFVRLVKDGFYDKKTFHRVVPNFVVQGGDPRGDGYGGPGYLVRDEFSPLRHSRGTVGLATSGKDTGGCQFFFNTSPNPHLDGRYTIFAEVSKGIDVVDKLEIGDQIISAKVQ